MKRLVATFAEARHKGAESQTRVDTPTSRSTWPLLLCVPALLWLASEASLLAQEPATRAEALEQEREAKAATSTPSETSRIERLLLGLEGGRLFERLLNPAEGFYPRIGNVTTGSGISFGPGYRNARLFGDRAVFAAFAAGSLKKYWMVSASLSLPDLAGGRAYAGVHASRFEFPEEDFFGIGPASRREDATTFGLNDTVIGGGGGLRVTPWLSLSGGLDRLSPRIGRGSGDRPIADVFDPRHVSGLTAQPDFVRYQAVADVNYRQPRGNPRRGGQYKVTVQQFDDRETSRFDFHRFEADLQQYIPLLNARRVIALRVLTSLSDTGAGHEVPFYLQRTLGGPDDLRGFRRFRFRDDNFVLLQAEYRWEIFTAMDGAIFYDAGKVEGAGRDLDLSDLESDYGVGFRFGTANGVFLRVEGAFGSSAGKHFILRFGHVF